MQSKAGVKVIIGAAIFTLMSFCVAAAPLRIAAASDLKFALDEILIAFTQEYTQAKVDLVYGSSGKLRTQIQHGAPYDMYFSADIAYPQGLVERGLAASKVIPYARGQLVLYAPSVDLKCLQNIPATASVDSFSFALLHCETVKHIAIANPKHAPYGIKAQEALQRSGDFAALQHKLIYAQSVSHATQYLKTKHAQAGIIALSLVLNDADYASAYTVRVPEALHSPLDQGFIVTQFGKSNDLAWAFARFIQQPAARNILQRYGFTVPHTQVDERFDD